MGVSLVIQDGNPNWWESPDIWVVPGTDPNGAPGTPVVGQTAFLWASVANQGDTDVSQVQVDFWVANPSLQIRKSTANHIGTAFADIAAGASQDVLCLVPWNVTLVNGGHECVVVEASSPADPLNLMPADPDVLDAPTYPQIAQRNLSVAMMAAGMQREIILGIHAGGRADKIVEVTANIGGDLTRRVLDSLGLKAARKAAAGHVEASLSEHSQCGAPPAARGQPLKLRLSRGRSLPVYLNIATRSRLAPDEYAVVSVLEKAAGRVIGGLTVAVVDELKGRGGGK